MKEPDERLAAFILFGGIKMKLRRITKSCKEEVRLPLLSDSSVQEANEKGLLEEAKKTRDYSKLVIPEDVCYVTIRPLSYEEKAVLGADPYLSDPSLDQNQRLALHMIKVARKAIKRIDQKGEEYTVDDLLESLEFGKDGYNILAEIYSCVMSVSELSDDQKKA